MQKKMVGSGQSPGKVIRVFALASFLNDLGSDMIYPVWPMFVTSVMGANMAVLGFIDGLGDALVSISQAVSGYLSDRIRKRKVFVWLGYLFGSFSRLGYALSASWVGLIPFRVLDRAGKIRSAPRDAVVADVSNRENRGKHFGLLRAMDNLGAVLGIVLCQVFINILGYRLLFFLAAVPSAVGALLIFSLFRENKTVQSRIFKGFSLRDLSRDLKRFLVLNALFALGNFSYSFLMIFARDAGFRMVLVPVFYLIFTALASLTSLPFGKLADRIGRKPLLLFSFICWALVCLVAVLVPGQPAVFIVFILYGLHKGALEPVQKTMVAEMSPPDCRASTLGGFQMVVGLCALPASLTAGLMWDMLGSAIPFVFSLAMTVIASSLLLAVRER